MDTKEALQEEKQRLIEELDRISMVTEHGERLPKKPEWGDEQGENANEVEEYGNRITLIKELQQALTEVEEKLAHAA